jgi:hypothetical protein
MAIGTAQLSTYIPTPWYGKSHQWKFLCRQIRIAKGELSIPTFIYLNSRLSPIFGDLLPFLFPVIHPHTNTLSSFTITAEMAEQVRTPISSNRNG